MASGYSSRLEDGNENSRQRKISDARAMINEQPQLWLGNSSSISGRDRSLFCSRQLDFLGYDKTCYAAKICHYFNFQKYEDDAPIQVTPWTCADDITCKEMVAEAGGEVVGFPTISRNPNPNWFHAKIDVKFTIPTRSVLFNRDNVCWGIFTALATNARIYRGPMMQACSHRWDAMILYDCVASPEGPLTESSRIGSRKWDILLIKICEDNEFPFIVVAIRDSGTVYEARNYVPGR
ncbi:hypothetical protein F5Y04DRAFT_275162 [Hypomontagnella monticulosa]|nr:hypothetical protein F5Y04DRAFT_275162 [Hypomontagnella monticulosa]